MSGFNYWLTLPKKCSICKQPLDCRSLVFAPYFNLFAHNKFSLPSCIKDVDANPRLKLEDNRRGKKKKHQRPKFKRKIQAKNVYGQNVQNSLIRYKMKVNSKYTYY